MSTYAIITRVNVEPDSIDELARLFDNTNRALVAEQPDWLGASFTANRETNEVTVIAKWSDPRSYELLRANDTFIEVMSQFAAHFTAPPEVSVNEILVEM